MKKIILTALALGALAGGVGFSNNQSTLSVQASTTYTWGKTKTYPNPKPFYYAGKSSVYLWSKYHTTKLHNLKNYPKTTWYLSKSVQMKHNGKSAIYYAVTSGNSKVSGYVWRGYLTKGINPYGSQASTVGTLEKQVISLFPGVTQDSQLQSIANQIPYLVGDEQSEYYKAQLGTQYSNLKSFLLSGNTTMLNQLKNGQITYKDYLEKSIPYSWQRKPLDPFLSTATFNSFNGWRIGVYAYPKSSNLYGNGEVLLLPSSD